MTLRLGSHTVCAGLAAVLDGIMEEWLRIVIMDKLKGLILAKVSKDWMVIFVEKNVLLELGT